MTNKSILLSLIVYISYFSNNTYANINTNCTKYHGSAFVSKNDKNVLGNPATTYICDKFPSTKEMQQIAIQEKQPITSFIKIKNIDKNKKHIFDIRYFFPDGKIINVCGHGTIFSSLAAKKHYPDLKSAEFFPDQSLYEGSLNLLFDKNGQSIIDVKKCNFQSINATDTLLVQNLMKALNSNKKFIQDILHCPENNDIFISLKNAKELRNLNVDTSIAKEALKKLDSKFRGVTFSAKSENKDFTYETRIMTSLLDGNEDFACGSANMETATYWNKKLDKNEMYVLYPHKYKKTKKYGGVQEIDVQDNKIFIKGYGRFAD